jgi:hypothetical protein
MLEQLLGYERSFAFVLASDSGLLLFYMLWVVLVSSLAPPAYSILRMLWPLTP